MPRLATPRFILTLVLAAFAIDARGLEPDFATPGSENTAQPKILNFPADLRNFRARAIKADGVFVPDIAFSVRTCPRCAKPYVFGIYPRLSRIPFDDLASVHRSIEESLKKAPPKTMYSRREGKMIPRACPYCGEPEHDARVDRAYFCHLLLETGDDLHIEYEIVDNKPAGRFFWRIPKDGAALKVNLSAETETAFKTGFDCHFSLRARWNEIFAEHWNDANVTYENVSPGVWFIFRPEKVGDAAFKAFAESQLKPDRDKELYTRMESMLKYDTENSVNSYLQWAGPFADKLSKGTAECFVGLSLPTLRGIAVETAASRNVKLVLDPAKPSLAGTATMERGALKIPVNLMPLARLAAVGGLSLHQSCSIYLGEGGYSIDAAEKLGNAIKAVLPECAFEVREGRILVARDRAQQERKIDLLALGGKLDPSDELAFGLYRDYFLKWDSKLSRFGTAPLEREVSPVGLPAFIERRIRPVNHLIEHNAPHALSEPLFDAEGKRCDMCYTSECLATVLFVDPTKPRFANIPDADAARRLYYAEGGILPSYIEAQDVLRFPGGLREAPLMLECTTAILYGSDVSSLANEAERASALAVFGNIPDDTQRVHFYALTTNCAAVAPRKLIPSEYELLKSRVADFLKEQKAEPGAELNLHFDLPRAAPKGKVLRRKK